MFGTQVKKQIAGWALKFTGNEATQTNHSVHQIWPEPLRKVRWLDVCKHQVDLFSCATEQSRNVYIDDEMIPVETSFLSSQPSNGSISLQQIR